MLRIRLAIKCQNLDEPDWFQRKFSVVPKALQAGAVRSLLARERHGGWLHYRAQNYLYCIKQKAMLVVLSNCYR